MDTTLAVWLVGFVGVWYFFLFRQRVALFRLVGGGLLFLLGMMGVFVSDGVLTYFFMFVTLLVMFKEIVDYTMVVSGL